MRTQNHGNGQSRVYADAASNRRSVNDGRDGYVRAPSKHILYCKAKILIPACDTPTEKKRSIFGMVLTTLLKVDTSVKIDLYKDPTQVPETPSKMRYFFFGRWKPQSKGTTIWPELKIGFDMIHENFFSDASALLSKKGDDGDYRLYEKELQALETEVIGFLLFSSDRQDRIRL